MKTRQKRSTCSEPGGKQRAKAGLAFASSGSLGLWRSAGVVPSLWRLEKREVNALLTAGGWTDVSPQSKRIGRACASRIVRARRTLAVLPCYGYEVPVENSTEPCFVEIALFKTMPKPLSVIYGKDKVQSFKAALQVRSAKGPEAPAGDATVNEEIAAKRQRGDDGVAIPVDADEMDVDGEQGSALRQFLAAHGLIRHDVPKDGCCLFHSVGHLLKLAKRQVHPHNALRDVAADTSELNTDGYHAVWDGNLPNGTVAENGETDTMCLCPVCVCLCLQRI